MPQIVWVNKGKQQVEFVSGDKITIGSDAKCDVCLPDTMGVEPKQLEIFDEEDVWVVRNTGKKDVTANSKFLLKPGLEKILGDKSAFFFGSLATGNYIVVCYINPDMCIDIKKISDCFESEQIRREADDLLLTFWKHFKPVSILNPHEFFNYVCGFMLQKFNAYTVSLNEVSEGSENSGNICYINRAVRRMNPDDKYPLSSTVIIKAIRDRSSYTFDVNDVDHQDPIKSILDNKVRKAACFPLKFDQKILGVLYVDSHDNSFMTKDVIKINAMIESGISQFCRLAFELRSVKQHMDEKEQEEKNRLEDNQIYKNESKIVLHERPLSNKINEKKQIQDTMPKPKSKKTWIRKLLGGK